MARTKTAVVLETLKEGFTLPVCCGLERVFRIAPRRGAIWAGILQKVLPLFA